MRLSYNSSSRPSSPMADASRDPGRRRLHRTFTGFRISPREAALVRNDGLGKL
jgi:hypothetical protein